MSEAPSNATAKRFATIGPVMIAGAMVVLWLYSTYSVEHPLEPINDPQSLIALKNGVATSSFSFFGVRLGDDIAAGMASLRSQSVIREEFNKPYTPEQGWGMYMIFTRDVPGKPPGDTLTICYGANGRILKFQYLSQSLKSLGCRDYPDVVRLFGEPVNVKSSTGKAIVYEYRNFSLFVTHDPALVDYRGLAGVDLW